MSSAVGAADLLPLISKHATCRIMVGGHAAHFTPDHKLAGRYKLFNDAVLRDTVLERLRLQCVERKLCPPSVTVRLGLIYGYATKSNAALLRDKFRAAGWALFDDEWLFGHLSKMARGSYENSTAAVVAKLLLRSRGNGFLPERSQSWEQLSLAGQIG